MLKMTASQKKMIGWFSFAIFLAMLFSCGNLQEKLYLYDVHTFLYSGLVIAWGFLVHQRIVNRQARQHLVLAAIFMLILFISRLIRWRCFRDNAFAQEYAWYAYYVSFVAIPLCSFMAALCVGKEEKEKPLRHVKWLWLIWAAFSAVVITNAWHQLFFQFQDETHKKYTFGPAYYASVGLMAFFAIASMVIIVKRCQVAVVRRYWFIPVVGMLFFAGLIVWYYVIGGSPRIHGVKFYNLQEVFCLCFIFPFESMIQIGIMPGNSRYALFFEQSSLSASILDDGGNVIFSSKTQMPEEKGVSDKGAIPDGERYRRSEKAIHGGKIIWSEDLTAIQRLDEEIQKVTEELEEENDLIRQENEIRSERIRYETKNHLYDKIAGAVREKALAIDTILEGLVSENKAVRENTEGGGDEHEIVANGLIQAMILGAFVKRMGNMMLITEEADRISTRELGSAVRESLEYFGLTGTPNDFQEKEERLLPSKVILLSYELLEEILESKDEIYSLMVYLDASEVFLFRILLDSEQIPVEETWRAKEIAAAGVRLFVEYVDDTWRVTLREDKMQGENRPSTLRDGKEAEA